MADDDQDRARKRRSLVIALGLLAFVVLVFVISYVRMSGNAYAPHF
jgi:hypothetical protein